MSMRVTRKVGPPPENPRVSLKSIVGILFNDAELTTKKGAPTQFKMDLDRMVEMLSGDLAASDRDIVHPCWDPQTSRPCCKSLAETLPKLVPSTCHTLYGRSDPTPCESRWTNTLPNFKMSLLRRIVYNVGPQAFDIIDATTSERKIMTLDGEVVTLECQGEQAPNTSRPISGIL